MTRRKTTNPPTPPVPPEPFQLRVVGSKPKLPPPIYIEIRSPGLYRLDLITRVELDRLGPEERDVDGHPFRVYREDGYREDICGRLMREGPIGE